MPTGLYVSVSTAYGQCGTAVKIVTADHSVHWDQCLSIQGRSLMFPHWLMPIFPSTSKTVHLEIRASFETVMLGRGEVLGRVETTLEELLVRSEQFEIPLPSTGNQFQSLLLKARRVKSQPSVDHGPIKPNKIDDMTDEAYDAYTLYRKSNDRKDLDSALKGFQGVLDRCPVEDPHRAAAFSNLAHVILYGFTKDAQTDIDHAISLFRSALTLCPRGHPDRPLSIFNLCKAHHRRYLHLQDHADLRKVVKLYLELLPICPEGSYLQLCVIEECNALPRDPSDESVSLRRRVLDSCLQGHRHHARSLNRLGGDLYTRFEQSGNIDDINEAVDLSRKALAACSDDGGRSFFLSVLSYTLKLRFHHLRNPGDIDECILLNREALSLRPPDHPARHRSLNNLAKALKARYEQYGNNTDLEEAMSLDRAAHDQHSKNSGTPQHSEEYHDVVLGQAIGIPEPGEGRRQLPLEPLSSDHQMRPRARNIVIFGESGSGKSSIINAIAQRQLTKTSNSAAGCTFRYEKHEVDLSGERFILFDTVGLNEGTVGTVPAAEAEENLRSLLRELMSPTSDGISLLVYCVRSVRISRALLKNYNLFYSAICRKKVPIVVVVTGLENQEPTMDSWWDTNGKELDRYGMHFEDHACVTTLRNHSGVPDVFTQRITESSDILRSIILNNCSEWKADENWFKLSFANVRNMIRDRWNTQKSSPRTLIICDPSRKEVDIAHGIRGLVETCSVLINEAKYEVHIVAEPKSPTPTSSIDGDLLIYYARADEQDVARRKFSTFCAAYHGDTVPVLVVVKGLNDSKAAHEWVEQYLIQNSAGHLFATYIPAGDLSDQNAEQELQELIQQSSLILSEAREEGLYKRLLNVLGKWL